ncbi:hypothetical protein D9757_005605 [Collybiopsis confluens]|uniref:Uncharacterized protein n=1 Tax=Collybiopsis confluens TaxID=2823264 RepID=A0A8H5HSR8_9AGAR|nr:hypothetical protein D9757_005605 [Collybiopsis confluens]
MSPAESLPGYTVSCPPPFYSPRANDGEEVLAATRVYRTPTGSFTARCHCSNVTVTLREQDEDVEIPVYHQQGHLIGSVYHRSTENFLQVLLKVEGKLKLNVMGQNSGSSSVKIVEESYELWSKSPETPICPATLHFVTMLPSTFREGGKEFPLPPSHKISLPGIPGLASQCSYTLKIISVIRGPLWNKNKIFGLNFKYSPRNRPSFPLLNHCGIPSDCPLFVATIKSAPEIWFEKSAVLNARPSSGLGPIEVQIFIPSERKFGLADEVPFHIQLTGPALSLQMLYSHLRLEHVDDGSSVLALSPPSPTLTRRHSSPTGNTNHFIALRVSLIRQVCVEVRDQTVWKSFTIGEGRVHPLPPPFESVIQDSKGGSSSSSRIASLDGAGDIKCFSEVDHGYFDAGRVKVQDYLVLETAPLKPSDSSRSPFFPLKIPVPICIVSESWSETIIP